MNNLTPVRYEIAGNNGVTYGGFYLDSSSEDTADPIDVKGIFEKLKNEYQLDLDIKFTVLPPKSEKKCDVKPLSNEESIEEVIRESFQTIQSMDNPGH